MNKCIDSQVSAAGLNTVVLKFGGSALTSPLLKKLLIALKKNITQIRPVIVHGGGELTDQMLTAAGFASEKVDGQRFTPEEQLDYVVGSLAGTANKKLVSLCLQNGIQAVGISLADGPVAVFEPNVVLGAVGVPDENSAHPNGKRVLTSLLDAGFTPVVSSVGVSPAGKLLNINADYAAASVASALASPLILLSDVDAVLDAQGEPIGQLSFAQAEDLIEQKFVQGGMHVKLRAALLTTQLARRTTAIASWKHPERLIAVINELTHGIRSGTHTATQILPQPTEDHLSQSDI